MKPTLIETIEDVEQMKEYLCEAGKKCIEFLLDHIETEDNETIKELRCQVEVNYNEICDLKKEIRQVNRGVE